MIIRLSITSFFIILTNLILVGISFSQKKEQIIIENADVFEYDEDIAEGAQRLIGNVRFRHEGVKMTCDSAYYFVKSNSINAFSRVVINQADTIIANGDTLYYNGNTKLAQLRGNITLKDPSMVLTTNYLDYQINKKIGYYYNGGTIISNEDKNTLKSQSGTYYGSSNDFYFKDSVKVNHPDYIIYSDTLRYNTNTEISFFYGPSTIVSDSNVLYTENGLYDTKKNIGELTKNSVLTSKDKILKADSIYYDRNIQRGEAYINVQLTDTTNKMDIYSHFGVYFESKDSAVLTDEPYAEIKISSKDSTKVDTLYIHSDTLRFWNDSIKDHVKIWAYNKVKFFRNDIQGMCDSLVYSESDSSMKMYTNPMIWAEKSQLHGAFIEIKLYDDEVKEAYITGIAYAFSQAFEKEDTVSFNQVKGDSLRAEFRNNQLFRMFLYENCKTRFYAAEELEGGGYDKVGFNKATSKNIIVYTKDGELNRVNFLTKPQAILFPIDQINSKELFLSGFIWWDEYRPKKWRDIFDWKEIKLPEEKTNNRKRTR